MTIHIYPQELLSKFRPIYDKKLFMKIGYISHIIRPCIRTELITSMMN